MNTTVQWIVDSEKKVWTQPVLIRLEVKETAMKSHPCANDATLPGEPVCS